MASNPPCVWRMTTMIVWLIFVSSCAFGGSSPVNVERSELDLSGDDLMAEDEHSHHIHKRAAVTLPDNVTFTLSKTGSTASTTEIRVGTKVSFQLQILFPQTTTDMLVELFAPDNESIVMMLCDVQVSSIGSNLAVTGSGQVVLDSQNQSSRYFDRALIDFANVTNSFIDQSDLSFSSIFIVWDAVMIENAQTQHDQQYWVSAGAEYNNEMEVWVGQASFTAKTTDPEPDSFSAPLFNLTGPTSITSGTSAKFRLDMYIDDPSVALTIDAFAPLNTSDVMSVCDMRVVDTGDNYKCGFNPEEHVATLHRDDNTRGYDRVRLELNTVTNKGSRVTGNVASNNRISVEFLVHVYDDLAFVGQTYRVGAAVQIGTQQIWAGIIDVQVAAYTPGTNPIPTWQVTMPGDGKASTTEPAMLYLDIKIPQNEHAKYALEVIAPVVDNAAVLKLCSVRIVDVGSNLACTNRDVTPVYSSRDDPLAIDHIYADLGTVTNVGAWGWQPYTLQDPNALDPDTVRIQLMVKATDHVQATPGAAFDITMGLVIDDQQLQIGTKNIEVKSPDTLANITEEMTPDWELAWRGGENVAIGGAGQFLFTITTKRNVTYAPFDIEALMPNSTGSTPEVSLCLMKVYSVGKNLPCVVASAVNNSVTYTSSYNSSEVPVYDRGVTNLQSVCNAGLEDDVEQDKLVIKVGFQVHADAGLTNGTEIWPSVGVMFSPHKMWVGQIKAWVRDDLTGSGTPGHVEVVKVSPGDVAVGFFAFYNVLVKSNPGDVLAYTLNISVSTTGLSVASVKVVTVGDNMPCTNGTALEAVYEKDANGVNQKGSIDFGTISNVGSGAVAANTLVDDDTILVEVVIGVAADIPGSSTLDCTVIVNGATATVPSFTTTTDQATITTASSNVMSVEFGVAPITDTDNTTDVVLGQSKRLELCAWTVAGTPTKMTFKMNTPIGVADAIEVLEVRNSFAGKNMPSLGSCKAGDITYTARAGSTLTDIGTVDLGYVYNNNFDTVDPDADKVCVDGIFRVQRNEVLTAGTILQPTGTLNVNDQVISAIQQDLTVVDNATFVDIYSDNGTLVNYTLVTVNGSMPDPLCLTPGDVYTLPVLLNMPPNTTSLTSLDVRMDLNQSACLTFQDMRLISVGKNLKGFGKDYDLYCTPNSTMGTTQMDYVMCSLGVVTNPGISHRCEDPGIEDDAIYLEMDFQVADCPLAEANANLTASLGLKVAGYIAILNYPVMVCRDGTEAPVYNITAQANSTGDTMYIEYDVRLDNTSKAEVHNASLVVMPPDYVTCNTLQSSSGTNMEPVVDTASPRRMIIELGSIYFTDVINLLVRCDATSGYVVPSGVSGHFTVVLHHLAGDVIPRAGSTLTSFTVWSDMDFVNFTATTVSDSGVSCTSAPVGLQDSSVIYDCQISSSAASISPAVNGRKGGTGWIPYVREGELLKQRYFQVYFANKILVDRIEIEQLATAKATQIKLTYSNDGRSFLDGDTIALTGGSPETVQVPNPRDSQVLRVYVTNNDLPDQQVQLTFEFHGCYTASGGPSGSTAVCSAANIAVPAPISNALFFHRSFLALPTGAVFVCDGVVKTKGTVSRCFVSTDSFSWQPLDPRVAAMVGHEPDTSRVFALSDDGVTYMSSGDLGQTWASTHSSVVTKAQSAALYVPARDVPWIDSSQLTRGAPQSQYQSNSWGADFEYLKKNDGSWTNKVKWDCC
ncbi:uncharacterized protein LOC143284788 [Babylonia areolata]|uniref:uncharacterized protein LOC143284788 n=1 Tax=Babylonia areolata TaxID=304850 RepID=UPI003FD2CAFB